MDFEGLAAGFPIYMKERWDVAIGEDEIGVPAGIGTCYTVLCVSFAVEAKLDDRRGVEDQRPDSGSDFRREKGKLMKCFGVHYEVTWIILSEGDLDWIYERRWGSRDPSRAERRLPKEG